MTWVANAADDGRGETASGVPTVAVLIPCLNEVTTVAAVVDDFLDALPDAVVYVYDNASTDDSATVAAGAGAVVRSEPCRGKGHVVRRMFSDIEADVYVLVDGDDTYPAAAAPGMIAALTEGRLDMVGGTRKVSSAAAYRAGHRLGNAVITGLVGIIFGRRFDDILTGYRVLSRRFVKSFPAFSKGFEIETEMVVHALQMRLPATEVGIRYRERPAHSASKLRTVRDGFAIAWAIAVLVKEDKPLAFFSVLCALLESVALGLAWPLLSEHLHTGLVPRLPIMVATAIALLGALALACGLILDTLARGRREAKRLRYLALPPPPGPVAASQVVCNEPDSGPQAGQADQRPSSHDLVS